MDKNLIKKELYKQKPIAFKYFEFIDSVQYETTLVINDVCHSIYFEVPNKELTSDNEIPAQLLIRWLV